MTYELKSPTKEQKKIINEIENNNLIVSAVAGSGKTTTSLHIAKTYEKLNILLLTYNRKLSDETNEKKNKLNLNNLEVCTFHSFLKRKYIPYKNTGLVDDDIIEKELIKNKRKAENLNYDIIIIDEAQDMKKIYYRLICRIMFDNQNKNASIALFGDPRQSIYEFLESDDRYLIKADKIFNINNKKWNTKLRLSQSFRMTVPMVNFINKNLLNLNENNKIISDKTSDFLVDYIYDNVFNSKNLYHHLEPVFQKYKPGEIFVLAPSLKPSSSNSNYSKPIHYFENFLKMVKKKSVYVPNSDSDTTFNNSDLDIDNKIVFLSFHQAKGLERKVVIVFNFDNSYFTYNQPEKNPNFCPNEMYVAVTRATELLIVIHHCKNKTPYFKFLNLDNFYNNVKFKSFYYKILQPFNDSKNNFKRTNIEVTQITNFIKGIKNFNSNLILLQEDGNRLINIKMRHQQEDVSCINGIIIPSIFIYYYNNYDYKSIPFIQELKIYFNNYLNTTQKSQEFLKIFCYNLQKKDIIQKILNDKNIHKLEFLNHISELCTIYNSLRNHYLFQYTQIKNFNWINITNHFESLIIKIMNSLNLSNNLKFEVNITLTNFYFSYNKVYERDDDDVINKFLNNYGMISGSFDCIDYDKNHIYELKTKNKICKEDYLQLILYQFLHKINKIISYGIQNIKPKDIICVSNKYLEVIEINEKEIKCFDIKYLSIEIINYNEVNHNITYEVENQNIDPCSEFEYYLFNIKTGGLIKTNFTMKELNNKVREILTRKMNSDKKIEEKEFLNLNLNILKEEQNK